MAISGALLSVGAPESFCLAVHFKVSVTLAVAVERPAAFSSHTRIATTADFVTIILELGRCARGGSPGCR